MKSAIIKFVLILGPLLGAQGLWAQQESSAHQTEQKSQSMALMRILTAPPEVDKFALMYTSWESAMVYLSNHQQGTLLDINYDILNNLIPVFYEEVEYSLITLAIDSVVLQQRPEVLVNAAILSGVEGDQLLVRLYTGEHCALYRKTLVEIIEPDHTEIYNVKRKKYKVDTSFEYFFHTKSSDRFFNFNSKKDLKAIPNSQSLEAVMKRDKLGMRQESDLVRIAQAYQGLQD